jgi:serralysin
MTVNTGTGNSTLDAMLNGLTWVPTTTPGTAVTVTYSFMTSAPAADGIVGFQPISSSDQALIEQALQTFSAVANITFTLIPGGGIADIMFGMANLTTDAGLTFIYSAPPANPQTGLASYTAAHTYFGTKNGVNLFLTLHELGNATGLTDFSGLPVAQDAVLGLPSFKANWAYSVMATNMPASFVPINISPITPQLLDIQALQYLYGANEYGHTPGATTSNAAELVYSFTTDNAPQCIWVGKNVPGKIGFDFSACTGSGRVTINLSAGSFSSTGITQLGNPAGEVSGNPYNNISIAYGTVLHHATGGGSGYATFQSVGTGNYSFTGLPGNTSTLDYSANPNSVSINLKTNTVIKDPDFSAPRPPFQLGPAHWQDKFNNVGVFVGNSSASETIHFSGASNQYSIVNYGDGTVTVDGPVEGGGLDTFWLTNIGNLVFTDKIIRI